MLTHLTPDTDAEKRPDASNHITMVTAAVTVSSSVNTPANEVMMTTTCSLAASAMMDSPASGDRQPATVVLIQQRQPPFSSSSSSAAPPSTRALSTNAPSLLAARYQQPETATFVQHLQQHSDALETVKQVLDANSDYLSHAANASAHEAAEAAAMLTDDFSSAGSYVTTDATPGHYGYVTTMQPMASSGIYSGTEGRPTVSKAKRTRQRALSMPAADQDECVVDNRTVAKAGRPSAAANKTNRSVLYSVNDNVMTAEQYCQTVQRHPGKRSRVTHASTSNDAGTGGGAVAVLMTGGGAADSFACHICGVIFPSDKYLSMHMPTHNAQHGLSGAGASELFTAEKLQHHIERHPPPSVAHQPMTHSSSTSSSSSLLSDARASSKQTSSGSATGGATWSCKICNKVFAQNSNFKNHMRTHSDERPYVCEVCNIGFKERYHLKKHHLFKHTNELKEKCRVCGKLFKDSTAVRAHERIHSEERPYSCRRCGKSFKTSECLWHHENRSKTCGLAAIAMSLVDGGSMSGSSPPSALRAAKKSAAATLSSTAFSSSSGQATRGHISNSSQAAISDKNNVHFLPSLPPIHQQQSGAMIAPSHNVIHNLATAAATPSELYIGSLPASSSQRSLAVFIPTNAVMGQQGYVQAPRIAIIRPMQPVSSTSSVTTSQVQPQQPTAATVRPRVNTGEQARMISVVAPPHHQQQQQQQPVPKTETQSLTSTAKNAGYQVMDVYAAQHQPLPQYVIKPEPIEIVDSEMCCEVGSGDGSMLAAEVEVKTSSPEPALQSTDSCRGGSSRKKFGCAQCGKRFSTAAACDKHALTHSESRPYKCDECDVGFKLKVHLKKHTLYRHSDDKPCPCTVCGKKFKDSSAVRLHERIHSTQRPFVCECGKTFKTKENLWGHRHRGPCDKMPLPPSSASSCSYSSGDEINTSSSSIEFFSPDSMMQMPDGNTTKVIKSENNTQCYIRYQEGTEGLPAVNSSNYLPIRSSVSTSSNGSGQMAIPTIRVVKREAMVAGSTAAVGGHVFTDSVAAVAGGGTGRAVYPKAEQCVTPSVRIVDVGNVTYVSPVQKESALPPFETFAPNVRTAFPAMSISSQETDQQPQQTVFHPTSMAERPSTLSDKCPTIQHLLRNNKNEFKAANSANKLPAIYGIFQPPQLQMTVPGGGGVTPNSPVVFSPSLSPSKSLYAVANSPGDLRSKIGLGPLSLLALSSPSSPSSQHGLLTSANPMMPAGVSEISPHTPPPSAATISARTPQAAELSSPAYSDFSPARTPKGHPSAYAALSHVYAMHVNQEEGGAETTLPIYYWDDEKKHTPLVVYQTTPTGVFHEISRSGFNQL